MNNCPIITTERISSWIQRHLKRNPDHQEDLLHEAIAAVLEGAKNSAINGAERYERWLQRGLEERMESLEDLAPFSSEDQHTSRGETQTPTLTLDQVIDLKAALVSLTNPRERLAVMFLSQGFNLEEIGHQLAAVGEVSQKTKKPLTPKGVWNLLTSALTKIQKEEE